MVISHVCVECGHDLARVRARHDPHYGLPLVHCPGCGKVTVRRMHPAWRAWRAFLRVKTSLGLVVFQLAAIVGFVAGGIGISEAWGQLIEETQYLLPGEHFPWAFPLGMTALFSVALGAWLTAGFAHWRARFAPWVIYFALGAGVLALAFIAVPYIQSFMHPGSPSHFADQFLVRIFIFSGLVTGAFFLGVWPGLWIERGLGAFRRWAWRARRRRLRGRRLLA
jgi:hypothetical protein